MLVVAAEHAGDAARQALEAQGLTPPEPGAFALLLGVAAEGPLLDERLLTLAQGFQEGPQNAGFRGLEAWSRAADLPSWGGFGSVRPPE
jgi:hypothetical protein